MQYRPAIQANGIGNITPTKNGTQDTLAKAVRWADRENQRRRMLCGYRQITHVKTFTPDGYKQTDVQTLAEARQAVAAEAEGQVEPLDPQTQGEPDVHGPDPDMDGPKLDMATPGILELAELIILADTPQAAAVLAHKIVAQRIAG